LVFGLCLGGGVGLVGWLGSGGLWRLLGRVLALGDWFSLWMVCFIMVDLCYGCFLVQIW